MARARPAPTPIPGQLTLEDWEQMLRASRQAPETAHREATSVNPSKRATGTCGGARAAAEAATRHHPVATELLDTPGALLTRTRLRELGLERRAVDAVFRALPVVAIPGYSRPMIRAEEYLELVDQSTYREDRVRPASGIMTRRQHSA